MNKKGQPTASQQAGDHILPFATGPTLAATADIRPSTVGQLPASTLIYADAAGCSGFLAAGIAGLGKNAIIVHTPLDAINLLENVSMAIDAAFVSLQDASFAICDFFGLLKDEFPRIRRIAFAQHESKREVSASVHACEHEMILWDPWDRGGFSEILKDALDCRIHRTRSSWSDLELFESFHGADTLAIAEIVRRYRHRVVHLVLDVTHDGVDREDIVQSIYLDIVRCLPSFERTCSAGHWIDRIACRTIRAYFLGELSRTLPLIEKVLSELPVRLLR